MKKIKIERNNLKKYAPKTLALSIAIAATLSLSACDFSSDDSENVQNATFVNSSEVTTANQAAAALYNAVLTENFQEVDAITYKFRELEFKARNGEDATMTDDDRNTPISISPYISGDANQEIEKRIHNFEEHLVNRQSAASYKFYVDSLAKIFAFYHSDDPDLVQLERSIIAYQAFIHNIDYTITDIRSLYGTINALKVCRYLIGQGDYSRVSPFEMRDFITQEVNKLISKVPTLAQNKEKKIFDAQDFDALNAKSLSEIQDLNISLPDVINYISLIDGIKPEQRTRNYEIIKDNYSKTLSEGQSYLDNARIFFECQFGSFKPFNVTGTPTGKVFKDVASAGKLQLNAVKLNLATPIKACEDRTEIYVLLPDQKGYEELLNRGINKMGDTERSMFKTDLALLKKIYAGKKPVILSLKGSNIAAVENHLEQNPKQGMFVGISESGPLFNANLKSLELLRTLDISPESLQIFASEDVIDAKIQQAKSKLKLVKEFTSVEDSMASLDFDRLSADPFAYLYERSRNIWSDMQDTYERDQNAPSADVEDTILAATAEEEPTTDTLEGGNTLVVATVEPDDKTQKAEKADTTIVATNNKETEKHKVDEKQTETKGNNVITIADNNETPSNKEETVKEAETPVNNEVATTETTETEDNTPLLTAKQLRDANIDTINKEIKRDNSAAIYELAIRKINGIKGVKKNLKEGRGLLDKASSLGNIEASFALGSILLNDKKSSQKDRTHGLELITKAADAGHAKAQNEAGRIYYEGKLVPADYQKALDYLLGASAHDHRDADYILAQMYHDGKGVEKNINEEVKYLQKAAKGKYGNEKAALALAEIYSGGATPNLKNLDKANKYYIEAARKGEKDAFRAAGLALLKANKNSFEGAKYLKAANLKNDKEVNKILMQYYIDTNNSKELGKYLANAPEEIQNKFPVEMGKRYENGEGVRKDLKKAEQFYREAIKQDKAEGYCRLGDMFLNGRGVKKDLRAAVGQFTQGSQKGQTECMRKLAFIKITEPNYNNQTEAANLLEQVVAKSKNDKQANAYLGAMKLLGQGTAKDTTRGSALLNNSGIPAAKFLRGIETGDSSLKSCADPVAAGVFGVKNKNKSWLAAASVQDPLFLKSYLDAGGSLNLSTLESDAAKVCGKKNSLLYSAAKPSGDSNDAEGFFRKGMQYYSLKNYEDAVKYLGMAAEKDHLKALNNLGVMQLFGIGTKQDGKEAFSTLMKAAGRGDNKAALLSSAIRMYGLAGGPKDTGKTIAFLTNMADKNNKMAAKHLVAMYALGLGVGKHEGYAFLNFIKLTK